MVSVYVDQMEFPAGGVVTGTISCFVTPSCGVDLLTFEDASGQRVSGRFADVGTYANFVFIPEPPLPVGEYIIRATVIPPSLQTTAFSIVETTFQTPTFTGDLGQRVDGYGAEVKCQEYAPDVAEAWFRTQTKTHPEVTLSVSGPYATQYRYSISLPGETPQAIGTFPLRRTFVDLAADEICYEVHGFSYLDDSSIELGSECLSTAGLGLGVNDQISGQFEETLRSCVIPPSGHEDAWCDVFASAFESKNCDGFLLDACYSARRTCSGGDQPSAEQEESERAAREAMETVGGSGGLPATGGTQGPDPGTGTGSTDHSGPEGSTGGAPATATTQTGCSYTWHSPREGNVFWISALLGVVYVRQRRRSHYV